MSEVIVPGFDLQKGSLGENETKEVEVIFLTADGRRSCLPIEKESLPSVLRDLSKSYSFILHALDEDKIWEFMSYPKKFPVSSSGQFLFERFYNPCACFVKAEEGSIFGNLGREKIGAENSIFKELLLNLGKDGYAFSHLLLELPEEEIVEEFLAFQRGLLLEESEQEG